VDVTTASTVVSASAINVDWRSREVDETLVVDSAGSNSDEVDGSGGINVAAADAPGGDEYSNVVDGTNTSPMELTDVCVTEVDVYPCVGNSSGSIGIELEPVTGMNGEE